MDRITIVAIVLLVFGVALGAHLLKDQKSTDARHVRSPVVERGDNCGITDTECILSAAISAIDPTAIKTIHDQHVVIQIAYAAALLGSDDRIQAALSKVEQLQDGIYPDDITIWGTSPGASKDQSRMLLLVSLGRISEALDILKSLKNQNKKFEQGTEPQTTVVGALVYAGKLELAREFLKETYNINFEIDRNTITENKWRDGYPQVLLIEAYLNRDLVAAAHEVADLLKEKSIFTATDGDAFVQRLFARYYAAKGTPEFQAEHKKICTQMEKELDNPENYKLGPDQKPNPFNAHPEENKGFQSAVENLYGAHCLSLYPEILAKINLQEFPGDQRLRDRVTELKGSPDTHSADDKVKAFTEFSKNLYYYRHIDVPEGAVVRKRSCVHSYPEIANGYSRCLADYLDNYHLIGNKKAEIKSEFDTKYP